MTGFSCFNQKSFGIIVYVLPSFETKGTLNNRPIEQIEYSTFSFCVALSGQYYMHIEINQLISTANQLTVFYVKVTLA